MTRAVGYCKNAECDQLDKGVFLMSAGPYYCAMCRQIGHVEVEKKVDHAPKDATDPMYRQVRVFFNFDPKEGRYTEIAYIVADDLSYGWTFDLYSPLIKLEERAFKTGEQMICALNSGDRTGEALSVLLDFSSANWSEQLKRLEQVLDDRNRRVYESAR